MILEEYEMKGTYLGFELSTEKLKAIQVYWNLDVVAKAEVKFDTDLAEFNTTKGVKVGPMENEFYVNPAMWVKAIDILLRRLRNMGVDFSTVSAISGCAQQHGSLYWSRLGIQTLNTLNAAKALHLQLGESAFTVKHTPIWMDSSAERQCFEMEEAVGGRSEMVQITGSKCYPRFTGPQIRKVYQEQPQAYSETLRISLVSSFLASIFLGDVAPIDYADASGMNLFDINAKSWSVDCLNACAPDLKERLGQPVSTNSIIGSIALYFVQRYGFSPDCKIAAFTGDNPSALAGMLVEKNWLAVSLDTSDTIMMNLQEFPLLQQGHVFCHPTEDKQFMGLLCFRNGSFARDIVKQLSARDDWALFNGLLNARPLGNCGNMALHFYAQEIIPNAKGVLRWNKSHSSTSPNAAYGVSTFKTPQTEIRALIEGQMLHRRAVATDMGFHFGEQAKIIVTGSASENKAILQVMSDVFNAPVYTQRESEAALLGTVYRAKYVLYYNNETQRNGSGIEVCKYRDYILQFNRKSIERTCEPSLESPMIYGYMLERYRQMAQVLESKTSASQKSLLGLICSLCKWTLCG